MTVNESFTGDVVLESNCRDDRLEVRPGESRRIRRERDAETCSVRLYVDGDVAANTEIDYHATRYYEVTSDGEVETSGAVRWERTVRGVSPRR